METEQKDDKKELSFSGKMGALIGCVFTACIAACLCACMIAATISFINWIF